MCNCKRCPIDFCKTIVCFYAEAKKQPLCLSVSFSKCCFQKDGQPTVFHPLDTRFPLPPPAVPAVTSLRTGSVLKAGGRVNAAVRCSGFPASLCRCSKRVSDGWSAEQERSCSCVHPRKAPAAEPHQSSLKYAVPAPPTESRLREENRTLCPSSVSGRGRAGIEEFTSSKTGKPGTSRRF